MNKIPKDFLTKYHEKYLNDCERIKGELKNNNTEILVFGETSSGKSLFLNTLLGDTILTSTVINCTSAITVIQYDKNKRIRARKTNLEKIKEKETKHMQEANSGFDKEVMMNRLFKEKNKEPSHKTNDSKFNDEWIEQDLNKVPIINLEESVRSFLKAKKENRPHPLYDLVELYYNSEVLENGITLIDSPGLNENEMLTKMVLKYLPKTTGIICVVSACQGVTLSLKRFLSEVAKLPNYSPNQMFIVVSHWDAVETEGERNEFLDKMLYEVRSILPSFDEKNVVKVNLKSAFNASKNKLENKDYESLMDNLVPFFKKAFKLKLQKLWIELKEVLRYTSNTIKVIHNKTQDIIDDNSLQLLVFLKELDFFEKNGEKLFQEFREFVKSKTILLNLKLKEIVNSENFKNQLLTDLFNVNLPEEEDPSYLEGFVERKITEILIHLISTREDIKNIFKLVQEEILQGANLVFGKILFDLNTFEQQMVNGKSEKAEDIQEEKPTTNRMNNLQTEEINSFNGFTDGEKVGLVVTSFIWVPLVIAGSLLALPVLGVSALAKKIKNAKELKYIKNNEKKWKGEVLQKYWKDENIGIIVDLFVIGSLKSMNASNENIILHVAQRIDSIRELLKVLLVKRQELSTFEEIFLLLRKEFEMVSEKLHKFYLFNVKHFNIHHRFITYDKNNDGRPIEIGKGAYGTVYKGKLNMKNLPTTPIAIKELNMNVNDSTDNLNVAGKLSIQDLISEEDALIEMTCPQIIKYYGCYVRKENGQVTTLNLIMRLADTSLDSLISKAQENPYSDKTVLSLSIDIANGIKFIHSKNWIHRDLKPANILILEGRAMLTDLGLCKPVESLTGTVCGTPLYMAPEVHTGQYKNKVDIWSFGLIIFELMNRGLKESSFKENITKEYLRKGVQLVIPQNWDPNFSQVISKSMSIDPNERPGWNILLELLQKFKF